MTEYPPTTYLKPGEYVAKVKKMELKRGDDCRAPWVEASIFTVVESNGDVHFQETEIAPLTNRDGVTTEGRQKFINWQLDALGLTANLDVDNGVADTDKLIREVEDDLLNATRATKVLVEIKEKPNGYTQAVFKQNLGAPQPSNNDQIADAFDASDVTDDEEATVF